MYTTNPNDGYDLFQRAIVNRDADAWAAIRARYRPLMCVWARRCPSFAASRESCEDIADEALARAWLALTPERFQAFPSLPALLAYLRTCVTSVVIDIARKHQTYDRMCAQLPDVVMAPLEELVIARLSQVELWDLVNRLMKTDVERLVLYERFVLDLPPRVIQARHPVVFPDVRIVYATLRNLCDRLRMHTALAEYTTAFQNEA
jgi:DNA-directed RNA polymerase specialized sigma24 family protein